MHKLSNFNSIKVQLEHKQEDGKHSKKYYFNSIKVQLEPNPNIGGTGVGSFQFHKGTIRTR